MSIGDSSTTAICTLRGIYNGNGSHIANWKYHSKLYRVWNRLSVLNGILNSAGSGTLDFTNNSVISCSSGTGIFCRDDEFCSCFGIEFK
jgi:hypothetical protein